MAVTGHWQLAWRISTEASFNAANPESKAEWHIGGNGGGANGWMDLPLVDSDGLQPKMAVIFPTGQGGSRAMNRATPVAGAYLPELGDIEFPVYPELSDRIFRNIFGSVSRAETAGAAAKSSVAFASLATLDTQPNGTEQLKFVISSSTAASSATINIVQSAATQETITIGTSGSSVDGTYYSKGGYDGSSNAITFTVGGTVTSGTVVVSGVDYATNTFSVGTTNPTLVIEQQNTIEGNSNSEYFTGVVVPTCVFNYDRAAADGLLTMTPTLHGRFPATATATTYNNDVGTYYRPVAAWNATVNLDDATYSEVVSCSMTLQSNSGHYMVSSGNQQVSGQMEGQIEAFGQMVIIPADNSRWTDYTGVTVRDLEFDFVTPFYVVDTTGYEVKFTLTNAYIEDYTRVRVAAGQTQVLGAQVNFRGKWNTTDSGPAALVTRCRMPA